jgi:hypothetical protein
MKFVAIPCGGFFNQKMDHNYMLIPNDDEKNSSQHTTAARPRANWLLNKKILMLTRR